MICPHCLFDNGVRVGHCQSCGRALGGSGKPPPFVGRARQLALMDEHLESVKRTGQPQLLAISGVPGSGRSRLMSEFRRRHSNAFSEVLTLRGYPTPGARYDDPFRPFGRLLHNAFGLDERGSATARVQRIRRQVTALDPPLVDEAVRSLCLFLGLRPDGPDVVAETPVEARRRAFGVLTWYLKARAERRPLVLVLEGMSDTGADGAEVLSYLHGHLDDCCLLILAEVDAGTNPAGVGSMATGVVLVDPLDATETGALVARGCGRRRAPPQNLLSLIREATEGRPGAVMQVAQSLAEHGIAPPGTDDWHVPGEGPLNLDFALTPAQAAERRLAALDPATRATLRRAAVVGPIFWLGALAALDRLDREGVHPSMADAWTDRATPALEQAIAAGVVLEMSESSFAGQRTFAFARPPEQAVLEAELDRAQRARMHHVVAQWMVAQSAGARVVPWLRVAEHTLAAGRDEQAAQFFFKAGQRARERFANAAAVEAFERARGLLDPADAEPRLAVCHALGALYAHAGRFDRSETCFEEMLDAAWRLDDRAKAGAALNRLGRACRERGAFDQATRLLARGQEMFAADGDEPGVIASTDDLGQVALALGEHEDALRLFEDALRKREAAGDERGVALSLTNLARLRRTVGDWVGAEAALREALAIRERIVDVAGVVASGLELAELLLFDGRVDHALDEVNHVVDMAQDTGQQSALARGMAVRCIGRAQQGGGLAVAREARGAIELAEQLGDLGAASRGHRAVALALVDADPKGAATAAQAALAAARHTRDLPETAGALVAVARAQAGVALQGVQPGEALDGTQHGHLSAAIKAAEEALTIYKALSAPGPAGQLRLDLAEWVERQGDVARAARLRDQA